jgi:hypothetical protein
MAGLDPNSPLVQAILQEKLRQSREAFNAQQKQAQGNSSGGWGSLLTIPATLLGAYAAREMFGRGSGSSGTGGSAGGIFGNIFGSGSNSGGNVPDLTGISTDAGNLAGGVYGGGMLGNTGSGVAGTTIPAGEAAGAASGFGQYVVPGMGAALGAAGLYDALQGGHSKGTAGLEGAASGAALGGSIGSIVPGVGTLIGAGIGGALGGGLGVFGSKNPENPEQAMRGHVANELDKSGAMPDLNKRSFNVDPTQNQIGTATGQLVGAVNPAAAIAAASAAKSPEEFAKIRSDTAGMIVNKLGSSQNAPQEVRAMYDRMGGHDAVYSQINALASSGMMARPEADAALAAIDMIYGVRNPHAPSADQARFDQFQKGQQFGGAQGTPTPTPAPTPYQLGSTGSLINTPLPQMPGQLSRPNMPALTPQQLAARKGAQEPIEYRLMNLDPRFANVFQKGNGIGGKQMGRSIFQVNS